MNAIQEWPLAPLLRFFCDELRDGGDLLERPRCEPPDLLEDPADDAEEIPGNLR